MGHVFGEENVTTCLLQQNIVMEEDIWHKILILALNYDIVAYPRIALQKGISIHNPGEEFKISLHKAVCCHALKIL